MCSPDRPRPVRVPWPRLLCAVGAAPTDRFVGPEDYLRAMLIEAGCEGADGGASATCRHGTRVGRSPVRPTRAKSTFIDAALPAAGTAAMIAAVEAVGTDVPGVGGGIVFDSYGGVINQLAPGDTAFVHRDAIACAQYSVTYAQREPVPVGGRGGQQLAGSDPEQLRPVRQGLLPELHRSDAARTGPRRTTGRTLPRLMKVKEVYDPDDVFHFAQSIPLPATTTG